MDIFNSEIKLWNDNPIKQITYNNKNEFNAYYKYIFPSARQGLTEALIKSGISRNARVAVPEWITNCVTNAISKVSMVIPIKEVVKYNIPVDSILLYEQWGWTYSPDIKDEILKSINSRVFILDRVDSADIENFNRINFDSEFEQVDLISLSKLIGLKGGGLAKYNGRYLNFNNNLYDEKLCNSIFKECNDIIEGKLLHINKSELNTIHPEVKDYIINYDVFGNISYECNSRRNNLRKIINSKLSKNWYSWMFESYKNGCAPGIVPLFLNHSDKELNEIVNYMGNNYSISSSIYNFNVSGSPINFDYKKCFALPIHGGVKDIEIIIKDLIKKYC